MDIRSRGGSKTRDFVLLALYLAFIGLGVVYYVAEADQLKQVLRYYRGALQHTFLNHAIMQPARLHTSKTSVTFANGGYIDFLNLTEGKARSRHPDCVFYDEEAQADEDAYNASIPMVIGNHKYRFHYSTPLKGTVFESNTDRLRRLEDKDGIQRVFIRKYNDISFLDITLIESLPESRGGSMPDWYWLQEYSCEFVLPSGAVFKNVNFNPYPGILPMTPECSGIDWNPIYGHCLVTARWSITGDDVYYTRAQNLGTDQEAAILAAIHLHYHERKDTTPQWLGYMVIEQGGTNMGYVDAFLQILHKLNLQYLLGSYIFVDEWDDSGKNKSKEVNHLLSIHQHLDKSQFPAFAKQVENACWDPDSPTPKLKKDPLQHYLDAGLHATKRMVKETALESINHTQKVSFNV